MNLFMAILKLRPLGGKERDFLGLAEHFALRGHQVTVVTSEPPQMPLPSGVALKLVEASPSRSSRHRAFADAVQTLRGREPGCDALVAFDRVPAADFLFVAERSRRARTGWRTLLPRHRSLVALEAETFGPQSSAFAFFLTAEQARSYAAHYGMDQNRMRILPTTFGAGRSLPAAYYASREDVRRQYLIPEAAPLLIQVAVNGRLKGLDRTIDLLARLPDAFLLAVGETGRRFRWQARRSGVQDRVRFTGYAEDVPRLLGAADLMVHPAREENTGTVILESLLYGVPAVVSEECGYAHHVAEAKAGAVIPSPFAQHALLAAVRDALHPQRLEKLKEAARRYGPRLVETGGMAAVADVMLEAIAAHTGSLPRAPRPPSHEPLERL